MTYRASGSGSASSGDSSFLVNHDGSGPFTDQRSVFAIITKSTVTVTNIQRLFPTAAGGWTFRSSSTAQGRTWWLYDKICDASEAIGYVVTLSGVAGALTWGVISDFYSGGDAIRAVGYGDAASASTLAVPSLTATRADDLYSLAWGEDTDAQQLRPDSPLTRIGSGITQGGLHGEAARQVWQSSSATGTRSYTMTSAGVFDKAFGVVLLVGDFDPQPLGGWGVGQVRMGAN